MHGPAIKAKGKSLPNLAVPATTTALGAGLVASFMAGPCDRAAQASTAMDGWN
jgi:hypothetical protein